ncbi:acyl-ACP--UDP-N-acetylglucosamine O-acyltransferase [Desulfobotulus mexicanus]|uniref:Acyl-[acyl-carrier-protein]--UDP-N-acetylglucosamine O-acyltransferase n=1 Tax=Desulfobotulus mexicanus TaxID=2586642 RepID=A0A5S5MDD0_9BACT|nr:acyl-ACP--UDP-N-acetylglucosamine O-acyltransferase [Desulfobotulus mexicanus]TYT73701.1 acyl-ACP--UDP-N-acetylglucosamine O-acyltransferase [Desulfobotulus mexicanus]
MAIHPTAIVDAGAEIGDEVEIGPFAIVKEHVCIGARTRIGAYSMVDNYTEIGPDCVIFPYAAVGGDPQDLKFRGEKSWLKVGRKTVVREFATLHRGTGLGGGLTSVGEENLLMAYCHVAHDCHTGKGVILSNNATLAGHVTLGDHVIVGGLAAVHQFVKVGDHAYIGGKSAVVKDIPPFVIASGDRATLHGLNKVGLRRREFPEETLKHLKQAYRIIFRYGLTLKEAIERVRASVEMIPEVCEFIDFIKNSDRGITR